MVNLALELIYAVSIEQGRTLELRESQAGRGVLPVRGYPKRTPKTRRSTEPRQASSCAASVRSRRNQTCAGSLAARRCQAIETVVDRSTGNGRISISAAAAIWRAVRDGTAATRSAAASAAGKAK